MGKIVKWKNGKNNSIIVITTHKILCVEKSRS